MEPQASPALFRRFPGLRGRIPHRPYLSDPTPVEPLRLAGIPEGRLFVKRDDRSCPLYGGNKPRKLEFTLAAALERGARRLVTTGGLGTNHGLATTILAREAGLATTLVLVDQPVTAKVRRSLLLFAAYGADLVHGRTIAGAAAATARALGAAKLRGERPVLLPTGGSSPLGNLGFVSAGLELAEQVAAGELPEPRQVHLAVGTGGSAAGLALGLRLGGLATRVVGVLVTDILPPGPRSLARARRASLRELRRADPGFRGVPVATGDLELVGGYVGPAYGAPTPEAEAAVQAAREAGIELETTYTGKCLAEIRDRAARGALPDGPVLFWNTYSSVDVEARAPRRATPGELPESIRRVLDGAGAA